MNPKRCSECGVISIRPPSARITVPAHTTRDRPPLVRALVRPDFTSGANPAASSHDDDTGEQMLGDFKGIEPGLAAKLSITSFYQRHDARSDRRSGHPPSLMTVSST